MASIETVPSGAAAESPSRWSAHGLQAAAVQAVVYLGPLAGSMVFVHFASLVVPPPRNALALFVGWWLALSVAATAVLAGVDRVTRRLLPLAALLKLSLVFPDEAPSRFRIAFRSGSVERLQERLAAAAADASTATPGEAATRLLELVALLNIHDRLTRGHCDRVRAYSVMIGEQLGLSREELDLLNWAALLHDVGKLDVPGEILLKPGRPSDEEWEILRRHPLYGEALVEPMRDWLGRWAAAVGYHHERWDGKGYPRGLAGEDIPLPGRIVAVADVFDVITSVRSYKKAAAVAEARAEIARCAGTQFDPRVVRAFLNVSLGRMRLVMGPLSLLAHAPLLGRLPFTPAMGSLAGALTVVATSAAGGIVVTHRQARHAPAAAAPRVVHVHRPTRTPPPGRTHLPTAPAPPASTPAPPGSTPTPPEQSPAPVAPGAAPAAADDRATAYEGQSVEIAVLENDTGGPLRLRSVTRPQHGSAAVLGAVILYRAPSAYRGSDSFGYEADGVDGATVSAGVSVDVLRVNHAPTFVPGGDVTVREDSPRHAAAWAGGVDAGDPGQTVRFTTSVERPELFSALPSVSPAGELTFTSAPDAFGSTSVTVRPVDDGGTAHGGVDSGASRSFRIDVAPVNDAPAVAATGDLQALEDSGPQLRTWASSIAPGPANEAAQTLSLTTSTDDPSLFAADGQPLASADGTITFTPAFLAVGTATVTVAVRDDGGTLDGGSDTTSAAFRIVVTPRNHPPHLAGAGDVSVPEDAPAQSLQWVTALDAGAPNESSQTVTLSSSSDHPELFSVQPAISQSGTLTFTPGPDASGSATVTVTAHDDGGTADGGQDTATTSFTLEIRPVDDAPSFLAGGNESVLEDSGPRTVAGWATQVSAGPPDESGQHVSFSVATSDDALFSVLPAVSPAGTLTYTPAADANGSATVTVTAHDDGGTADGGVDASAPQTFTIAVAPVNDAPSFLKGADQVVLEDSGAASVPGWATAIGAGPADEGAQTVSFDVTNDDNALFSAQPAVDAAGTLTYTPAPDANGSATVTVTAHDDGGTADGGVDASAPQTFTITVAPVNDAPSFLKGADQVVLDDGSAQAVSAWATAIGAGPADESGQSVSFTVTTSDDPLFASLPTIDSGGALRFATVPGALGSATVTVTAHDDGGTADGGVDASAAQTFTITAGAPPSAQADAFSSTIDTDVVGDVLANDSDPQGSQLTLQTTPASAPASGTLTLDPSGSFVYAPNAGFAGSDSFTYTVTNGLGFSATATVSLTITSTSIQTTLVASASSNDALLPFSVGSGTFTPASGTTYLVFVGHVSGLLDTATLTASGSLTVQNLGLPVASVTSPALGSTYGWVWEVTGTGASPSSLTATFLEPNSKSVASDVMQVVAIPGSYVSPPTTVAGAVASHAATVALSSPSSSDAEIAFLYVSGDTGGPDLGWVTPGIAIVAGSYHHSAAADTGYGALVAYAPSALASATTQSKFPAHDGDPYVSIAFELTP